MTAYLPDLFDVNLLQGHLNTGYVRKQVHPSAPLAVLNYGPMVQYEKAWDEVTSQTRGLIYNAETLEVVARPWRKFFNYGEVTDLPPTPVFKSNKYDGSLGILYGIDTYDSLASFATRWQIASRGSFTSDQARKGSSMFLPIAIKWGFTPLEDRTYLFEILYPANRIVVDYHGVEGLVLLDVIDNATGRPDMEAFAATPWPFKADKTLKQSFLDVGINDVPDDEEGFVLYWPMEDLRLKVKGATYLRLHRLMTGCSARTIWECLAKGDSLDELIADVPDEFYDFVKETESKIRGEFDAIVWQCQMNCMRWAWVNPGGADNIERRKNYALWLQENDIPYKPVMFKLWDCQPYDDIIWKLIRPEATRPFWNLSEDVA